MFGTHLVEILLMRKKNMLMVIFRAYLICALNNFVNTGNYVQSYISIFKSLI